MNTPHPLFDLSGKRALVTGSSQGIGLALAQALASSGAHVIINGRDAAKCERVAAEFATRNETASVRAFDVTDAAAVLENVEAIERDIGPIDILVNNTGIQIRNAFTDFPLADFQRLMDTNVTSAFIVSQTVVRHMVPRGRGKIINVGAFGAQKGCAQMGAYAASKASVMRLTESMAAELREKGINVNAVLPTIIDTPQNRKDMPDADPAKWVAPEALADVVMFLASDASRAVHGALLPVTGLS